MLFMCTYTEWTHSFLVWSCPDTHIRNISCIKPETSLWNVVVVVLCRCCLIWPYSSGEFPLVSETLPALHWENSLLTSSKLISTSMRYETVILHTQILLFCTLNCVAMISWRLTVNLTCDLPKNGKCNCLNRLWSHCICKSWTTHTVTVQKFRGYHLKFPGDWLCKEIAILMANQPEGESCCDRCSYTKW